MQWKYAIMKVLADYKGLMHYTDIADNVINKELRDRFGATPANTVNVYLFKYPDLFKYIDNDEASGWRLCEFPPEAELQEMNRQFNERSNTLNSRKNSQPQSDPSEFIEQAEHQGDIEPEDPAEDTPSDTESIEAQKKTSFVTSKGILWRRDSCRINSTKMQLLGIQNPKDLTQYIEFTDQIGIYILYLDTQPIYVGQALRQSLGMRLKQHTTDRFQYRWNRFSWFGIKTIGNDKMLVEFNEQGYSTEALINGLEGVLIDIVGTGNFKSGNGMAGTPYLQYMIENRSKEVEVLHGYIVEEFYGGSATKKYIEITTSHNTASVQDS
jgi:hypothetical protein